MTPLSSADLLKVWEDGRDESIIDRSLRLLAVASSANDRSGMAKLSIGERDARLLQLREWMFGSRLINTVACPQCSERMEWENNVADLRLQNIHSENPIKTFELETDGYKILFRLPNSEDIKRAIHNNKNGIPAQKLLSSCILEVIPIAIGSDQEKISRQVASENLPDEVYEKLNTQMAEEDPQANIRMVLTCPNCSHSWEVPFDILSYLSAEIDNWARHVLQDVFVLARNFGWSERDILNMSPMRRQLYLEMLRS